MSTSDSKSQPARVLIVDDHPNTAEMLARVIRKLETPVEVLTASSGEDALQQLGDGVADILITDFMMPGMSGLELIEKLQEGRKPAHTILMTAYDTPGLSITIRRLDIQDYLVKPVDPERIRDIVSKAIKEIMPYRMAASAEQRQRPFKILIADDYPDNVSLLSVRLRNEGYEHITAMDGDEALEQMRTEQPDLALLDVNMPHKDGFVVLKEMRSDPSIAHIPAIMITAARIGVKDVQEGLRLGADDYVTKPVDWRELAARIRAKLRVKQAEDVMRTRAQELGVLPEISQDIGERMDIEALTKTVLTRTVSALQADNGHLVIFHPDGTVSHQMNKMFDFSPWNWGEVQQQLTSGGIVSEIVDTREGAIIADTEEKKNWLRIPNDTTRSAIAMPLLGRRDVIGVLTLTHNQPNHFKSDNLNILGAITSQAAIAIENAQLYAVERKRVNELVALNQLTREISRFSRSAELHEKLPELVRQRLGYPAVALWLLDGEKLRLQYLAGKEAAPRQSLMEIGPNQALVTQQPVQLSGPLEERQNVRDGDVKPPVQSVTAVPFFQGTELTGVISIHSKRASAFQESDRVVLETLAMQIETASERIRLFESVEQEKQRMDAVDSYGVQPHQVERLKDDPRYQSFSGLSFGYTYIGYNMRRAPFNDRRVRRALGMAVDTDKIIQYVLYGQGDRITGPFVKQTDFYDHSIPPLPYDPEGALRLLEEVGWRRNQEGWLEKDGRRLQFTLITNSGNDLRKAILAVVQDAWRQIGIDVRTDLLEWSVFIQERVNKLDFDALILGWQMGIDPDLYQIWHSSQTNPYQLNFVGFQNSTADDLIIKIRQEYDHARQVAYCHQLHDIIADEQPYTFLYVGKWTAILDKRIVIKDVDADDNVLYRPIEPTKTGSFTFYFNKWIKLSQPPSFALEG